ncbi:MAG: hypothetical protein E7550_05470 [Ruminococcaceae bacterium]|nr:hypothetical protein [Oscillospiraceae bacterium]
MKNYDFKKLYSPFLGSVAHIVAVCAAALALAAGLIFSAHLLMHSAAANEAEVPPVIAEESEAVI